MIFCFIICRCRERCTRKSSDAAFPDPPGNPDPIVSAIIFSADKGTQGRELPLPLKICYNVDTESRCVNY